MAWQNPVKLATFRFCLLLPLDLCATAKAQLCDTYFLKNRMHGGSTAGGKVVCLAYRFEDKWRLLRLGAWPVFRFY